MYWTSTTLVGVILTFVQLWTLSSSFLTWNPQDESQLVVVRKYNEQCQWYNSGFMGLIPRTFNRTTICRCKFIGVYECSTLTVHKSNSSSSSEPNLNSWTFLHSRKFKAPAPHNNSTLSSSTTTSNTTSSTDTKDKDDKSLSTTASTMGLFPHFSQGTSSSIEPLLLTSSSAQNSSSKAAPSSTSTTDATSLQQTTANYT